MPKISPQTHRESRSFLVKHLENGTTRVLRLCLPNIVFNFALTTKALLAAIFGSSFFAQAFLLFRLLMSWTPGELGQQLLDELLGDCEETGLATGADVLSDEILADSEESVLATGADILSEKKRCRSRCGRRSAIALSERLEDGNSSSMRAVKRKVCPAARVVRSPAFPPGTSCGSSNPRRKTLLSGFPEDIFNATTSSPLARKRWLAEGMLSRTLRDKGCFQSFEHREEAVLSRTIRFPDESTV